MSVQLPIDINRIMEMIPHRYPILLVDRLLELRVSTARQTRLATVEAAEGHVAGRVVGITAVEIRPTGGEPLADEQGIFLVESRQIP